MEADLQELGVDYRDRWRDVDPPLTLRRICVLVFRRPRVGGCVERVRTGTTPFTRAEHIADETRRAVHAAVTNKVPDPWPDRFARPKEEQARHEFRAALQAERMRRRQREVAAIEEGCDG